MAEALKEARQGLRMDEVPVGTVITFENKIIARAHNQIETLKDPTAHAEMIAITQAANTLSSKWLHDCTMYVTLEPCCMCAGALVLSRIKRIVIGTADPKSGACGSVFNIGQQAELNHKIEIEYVEDPTIYSELLKVFFKEKRKPRFE